MKAYCAGPDTNGLIVAIRVAFNREEAHFFRSAKCRFWPFSTDVADRSFGRYRGKSRHGRVWSTTT